MMAKSMHQIARIEFRNSKFRYARARCPLTTPAMGLCPLDPHQGASPLEPPSSVNNLAPLFPAAGSAPGRNGRGYLYFGVDIILLKHQVKGLSKAKHTLSMYILVGYTDPKFVFFSLDLFIMIYRGEGHFDCGFSVVHYVQPI